eukprot:EG_transcript_48535
MSASLIQAPRVSGSVVLPPPLPAFRQLPLHHSLRPNLRYSSSLEASSYVDALFLWLQRGTAVVLAIAACLVLWHRWRQLPVKQMHLMTFTGLTTQHTQLTDTVHAYLASPD